MKRDTVFIWLGGVLVPATDELVLLALGSDCSLPTNFAFRQALRKLSRELSLGQISEGEFCEKILQLADVGISKRSFEEKLLSHAAERSEVVSLLQDLPEKYSLWLLSDFPKAWLERIPAQRSLTDLFSDEQRLILPDLDLDRFVPDLYQEIERRSGRPLDKCILIDPNSCRAIEATKRGLSGVIYVYPRHLEHEFTLRKMIATDAEILHPTGSGRVSR